MSFSVTLCTRARLRSNSLSFLFVAISWLPCLKAPLRPSIGHYCFFKEKLGKEPKTGLNPERQRCLPKVAAGACSRSTFFLPSFSSVCLTLFVCQSFSLSLSLFLPAIRVQGIYWTELRSVALSRLVLQLTPWQPAVFALKFTMHEWLDAE